MYTQKIAIIFDDSQEYMALDHSRLGVENKSFQNKITQFPEKEFYAIKTG